MKQQAKSILLFLGGNKTKAKKQSAKKSKKDNPRTRFNVIYAEEGTSVYFFDLG